MTKDYRIFDATHVGKNSSRKKVRAEEAINEHGFVYIDFPTFYGGNADGYPTAGAETPHKKWAEKLALPHRVLGASGMGFNPMQGEVVRVKFVSMSEVEEFSDLTKKSQQGETREEFLL